MDLTTTYLGMKLKNPVVPSAGPISQEISSIKALEDAGAAAVVLYSLFEEQIEKESLANFHYTTAHNESYAEATSYFPDHIEYKAGPDEYLELIRKAKEATDIPVIASLNGSTLGGWVKYAHNMEEAGADALELNIYKLATDFNTDGREIEQLYIDIVKEVKKNVKIPVAIKLSPFFSSTAWMADQLDKAGADGLVLFNRFYQPDIDLDNLEVVPNVLLSTPMAMRLPLRWIGILFGRLDCDLAATSGIYSEKDVIKMLMVGAKVTQMMSSILKFGPNHIADVISKMKFWMEANEYNSVDDMRGSMSYMNVGDPSQYERANYMKVISSVKL